MDGSKTATRGGLVIDCSVRGGIAVGVRYTATWLGARPVVAVHSVVLGYMSAREMSIAVLHRQRGPRWGRRMVLCLVVLVLAAVAFVVVQLERPLPGLSVSVVLAPHGSAGGAGAVLPWPLHGSAAVEVLGVGPLGSFNGERTTTLAGVTKLMTALVVLRAHPLVAGESGPAIRVRPADVATYKSDLAGTQSVLKVEAGEELSERQALEGSSSLLPTTLPTFSPAGTPAARAPSSVV